MTELRPTREGYADELMELGGINSRIVVLDADVSRSIGTYRFGQEYPDRWFNLGASEQDMIGEAAGLALSGYTPFVSTYGVFVAGRAWDQIRLSVCYMNLDVKIGGAHAGISVGPDGATHQALEDMAIMRVLPNMKVLAPADYAQTRAAVRAAAEMEGPVYIRFGRNPVPVIYGPDCTVKAGAGHRLREGSDVTLVACGIMVYEALRASTMLEAKGVSASVVNMVSVKPLDEALMLEEASRTGKIIVAEDHQSSGGLFGAVSEFLSANHPCRIVPVSVRDSFGTSGTPAEVREEYGLTAEKIAIEAGLLLERFRE